MITVYFFLFEFQQTIFQGINPLHLGYQICEHKVFHSVHIYIYIYIFFSCQLFIVYGICNDVFNFLSDINLHHLPPPPLFFFFPSLTGLETLILEIYSQSQDFIFKINFLILISLMSAQIFITYFLSFTLDLICSSFTNFLRWKLRLL